MNTSSEFIECLQTLSEVVKFDKIHVGWEGGTELQASAQVSWSDPSSGDACFRDDRGFSAATASPCVFIIEILPIIFFSYQQRELVELWILIVGYYKTFGM